jgi:uncharacterized protein
MGPLIDAHVHLYPPEAGSDPAGWAARHGELHWAELVVPRDGKAILQGWADPDLLMRDMDEAGIDRAVLLGWYWENHDTCGKQNGFYADVGGAHPDRVWWFATVHPAAGQAALDAMRVAAARGARGLGELSPAAQGFSLRDPPFRRVAELAMELGWPINFHVNEALGRSRAGRRFDVLEDFQWLATTYPDLKIILSHWGGLIPFFELNRAVRRDLRNVFYDTSASPLLYDRRIYRTVADVVGAEKIIYGSDYPLLLFPRAERIPGFQRMLEEVRASGLSEAELAAVLGGNILRLLGP